MTLASIGRFHFFEQARALARACALDRFYCDDPRVWMSAGARRGRWLMRAGLLHRWAPVPAAGMLSWRGGQVARSVGSARLVKINSAFALETIRRGSAGEIWVDHGSLDERYVADRMRHEAESWGDPLVALGGNHGSPLIQDREAEEFALATGVVVASSLAARTLVGQGVPPGKVRVVGLGVDAQRFAPRRWARPPGRFRILHAGPVTFNKGVHRLLAAFREAGLPGAELRIAGLVADARVGERLMRQASGLDVQFCPPVPQSMLPELFAGCDLFVLASLADGFGLTVLQAMACELPVVVTDQCGCCEVIAGCPSVEVVRAGETATLAAALVRAYQSRDESRGPAARCWAQQLDWNAHACRLGQALGPEPAREELVLTRHGVPS